MQNQTGNILDLLMGGLAAGFPTVAGGNAPGNESGSGEFQNTLDGLLGMGSDGSVAGAAAVQEGDVADFELLAQMMPGGEGLVAETAVALNRQISAFVTDPMPLQNNALRDIINRVPTDLKPGTYDVLSVETVNGSVNLELSSQNGGEPIRLSMPASLLSEQAGVNNSSGSMIGRTALDGMPRADSSVDRLLASLNLKEIQISEVTARTETAATSTMQISLIGENPGQTLTIKARLDKDNLRATKNIEKTNAEVGSKNLPTSTRVGTQVASAGNNTGGGNSQNANLAAGGNGPNQLPQGSAAKPMEQEFNLSLQKGGGLADLLSLDGNQTAVSAPGGAATGLNTDTESVSQLRAQPMRFTLPDDLDSQLKPGGRAVTIRIEPENLGPARLSLSYHNDQLRARLAVHSPEAKLLIEQSIDKLNEQLARADIKVDYIEVTISGEDSNQESLEQRALWQRMNRRALNLDSEDNAEIEESEPLRVPPAMVGSYAGPQGINVLA